MVPDMAGQTLGATAGRRTIPLSFWVQRALTIGLHAGRWHVFCSSKIWLFCGEGSVGLEGK